ncbi:membrane-spanning 4-domains subfamily A member 4A-like isoform X3 [Salarias fasciatus]|uniref:membrane-spanning 4-domains subfamily A member 4A-like isoform X3 n=1 Tax=Salarias fasciatus TaxID=181472 RepID=UPI0011768FA6|nr:membrane-spanning 4-domains subfamily A member 4A-like isoform X3 [Salarias fasciatus]
MASSAVSYTSGNVMVVTHVLPAAPSEEQQPPLDERHKFRKGHPKALGTVQIIIGVLTLLFGIAAAVHHHSLGVYSGIYVWGASIYIASGSVTVAAEKSVSRDLINVSLVLNIITAIVAVAGVFLYALDPVVYDYYSYDYYDPYNPYGRHHRTARLMVNYGGFSVVVAVFQFLQLIVSITVAAYACNAICCCCTEEPQVVQAVGPVTNQASPHFQAASVAPAQPYPQVEPNFKNPGFLGSAEPPAYQPN